MYGEHRRALDDLSKYSARLRQHDFGDAEQDVRHLPTRKKHGKGEKQATRVQELALAQKGNLPGDL